MDESAGDSGDEECVRDPELDGVVQGSFGLGQHRVKLGSLRDSPGETVEDEAGRYISMTVWHMCATECVQADARVHGDESHTTHPTHPSLHSAFELSSSLIIPTIISSLTRSPLSMIFLASLPKSVCRATCDRSMSPVDKWHTQYLEEMLGACVPLPENEQCQMGARK